MRPKHMAGVLALTMAILTMAPIQASALEATQLALNDQPTRSVSTASAAKPGGEPWYARAWQKIRGVFGGSQVGNWTDKELASSRACGSWGCTCCHSSIMEPRNIDDSFVHPSPPGSTEQVNNLYWHSAKAIAQMNANERDTIRRKIRSAIANGDTMGARTWIDASVGRARSSSK